MFLTNKRSNSLPRKLAAFIEPMECLPVTKLPEGQQWLYEVKLDGYNSHKHCGHQTCESESGNQADANADGREAKSLAHYKLKNIGGPGA